MTERSNEQQRSQRARPSVETETQRRFARSQKTDMLPFLTTAGLLQHGDAAARQRSAFSLQRSHGNAFVQRLVAGPVSSADTDAAGFGDRLARQIGDGGSLDPGVRDHFERLWGVDLSGVRVHQGAEAASLATAVDARAFTTGQDVFFREGAYDPGSLEGFAVLAHELAHTLQQRDAAVMPGGDAPVEVSEPSDSLEQEADAAAHAAVSGERAGAPAGVVESVASGGTSVQRAPWDLLPAFAKDIIWGGSGGIEGAATLPQGTAGFEEFFGAPTVPTPATTAAAAESAIAGEAVAAGASEMGAAAEAIPETLRAGAHGFGNVPLKGGPPGPPPPVEVVEAGAKGGSGAGGMLSGALSVIGGALMLNEGVSGAMESESVWDTVLPGLQIGAGGASVLGGIGTIAGGTAGGAGVAGSLASLGPAGAVMGAGLGGFAGGKYLAEDTVVGDEQQKAIGTLDELLTGKGERSWALTESEKMEESWDKGEYLSAIGSGAKLGGVGLVSGLAGIGGGIAEGAGAVGGGVADAWDWATDW